jgi:hypothetical protein
MITWNREVTIPLTDLKQEKNLLNRTLKLYKRFITNELNKVYGFDIRVCKSKSDPPEYFGANNIFKDKEKDCITLGTQSEDDLYREMEFNNFNAIHKLSNGKNNLNNLNAFNSIHNSLSYGLGSGYQICIPDSKSSILEDVYTFDFQARYFLEQ